MPRVHEMLARQRAITPTTGLWDSLDYDTQVWLSGIALNVVLLLGRGRADDAWDELQSHQLEGELHAAIWTRFESGQRRVLSAVAECRRQRSAP